VCRSGQYTDDTVLREGMRPLDNRMTQVPTVLRTHCAQHRPDHRESESDHTPRMSIRWMLSASTQLLVDKKSRWDVCRSLCVCVCVCDLAVFRRPTSSRAIVDSSADAYIVDLSRVALSIVQRQGKPLRGYGPVAA